MQHEDKSQEKKEQEGIPEIKAKTNLWTASYQTVNPKKEKDKREYSQESNDVQAHNQPLIIPNIDFLE